MFLPAMRDRSLAGTQLAELLDKLLARHPGERGYSARSPARDPASRCRRRWVINPFNTLHHAMALIARAELIISLDTSLVVHMAAWNKPLIAVYTGRSVTISCASSGYEQRQCGSLLNAGRSISIAQASG